MRFLKTLAKPEPPAELTLTKLLHKHLRGVDEPRPLDRIHASDVTKTGYCPREPAIHLLEGIPKSGNNIDPALQYTFDEGNDKQARFNNDWLRDRMRGRWRCPLCKKLSKFGPAPTKCGYGACGVTIKHEYAEIRVQHPLTGMLGSFDAFVDLGKPKLTLVECKIMKGDDFEKLKAPLAEHRLRTQLYLRLIRDTDTQWLRDAVDFEVAHVLYMMRGHGKKNLEGVISPFKEYKLKANDKTIRPYLARAGALGFFLRTREESPDDTELLQSIVPGGVCSDIMCPRAGKCKVAKACFSGKYPAGVTWSNKPEEKPVHPHAKIVSTDTGVYEKDKAS